MPKRRHTIVKLDDDLYVEWSSVVDAPVGVYNRADLEAEFASEIEQARQELADIEGRLARLDERGHTAMWTDATPQRYVAANRAGENETRLTWDELVTEVRSWLAAAVQEESP